MPEQFTRQVLFNHIPKTGGITLRIILNRVYGEQNIFLIKSTDVGSSLRQFSLLSTAERGQYKVVAGHGAEMLSPMVPNPYRVTVMREPVSLFLSQFYYLKNTRDAGFYEELKEMESLEKYLDFAIKKGQDNLLTRYLSNSVEFLADPSQPVPDMQIEGDRLLEKAVKAMMEYDAVIDLADFDAGVFALARMLEWKRIPIYRPSNRNRLNPGIASVQESAIIRIKDALRWDIELYQKFRNDGLAAGLEIKKSSFNFMSFKFRQAGISFLTQLICKISKRNQLPLIH